VKLNDEYLTTQLGDLLGYHTALVTDALVTDTRRLVLVRAEGEHAALAVLDLDADGKIRKATLTRWGTHIASEKITMREVTEFLARPEPS
jgi:hypothetical protein